MERIVFYNEKGGVGKTTMSVHIAYALATFHKKRTLVVDLDRQRNSTVLISAMNKGEETPEGVFCPSEENKDTVGELFIDAKFNPLEAVHQAATQFGQTVVKNMYVMPAYRPKLDEGLYHTDRAYKDRLTRLHDQLTKIDEYFDYAIIDCSPSGNSIINDNAVYAADTLVVPVDSSLYAAIGLQDTLDQFEKVRGENASGNAILVRSKMDVRNKIANTGAKELSEFAYPLFAKSVFRSSTHIEQAAQFGITIFEYKPQSIVSKEIKNLTKEVMRFHNG